MYSTEIMTEHAVFPSGPVLSMPPELSDKYNCEINTTKLMITTALDFPSCLRDKQGEWALIADHVAYLSHAPRTFSCNENITRPSTQDAWQSIIPNGVIYGFNSASWKGEVIACTRNLATLGAKNKS